MPCHKILMYMVFRHDNAIDRLVSRGIIPAHSRLSFRVFNKLLRVDHFAINSDFLPQTNLMAMSNWAEEQESPEIP